MSMQLPRTYGGYRFFFVTLVIFHYARLQVVRCMTFLTNISGPAYTSRVD